jgi:DNA-binding NtrC family response regulator
MRVLVVDDEPKYARLIARLLTDAGHDVRTANGAAQALVSLDEQRADILLTDLRMPGMSGIELMSEAKRRNPQLAAILMTAFADVATARDALKRGALDYLVKPIDERELLALMGQATGSKNDLGIIGESAAIATVRAIIARAATSDAPVLLTGESGTGKELAARAVHDLSKRTGPLIDVHIAALPDSMIESELFGYERGAFTGADRAKAGMVELADNGTLFLDEIGELSLSLQPKLLRFLQERRFWRLGSTQATISRARFVAATNRDLAAEVEAGRFRSDLYYRLDVLRIELPPLRERDDDVIVLAEHFLRRRSIDPARLTAAARARLKAHSWPGNIRELANAIERALVLGGDGELGPDLFPKPLLAAAATMDAGGTGLREQERELVVRALERAGGNKTKAAELLKITRRRLYSRMRSLGLDAGPDESDEP